ncbi:MAG: 50S ribosomal protein L9 [Myxococcales bacterium]|jgi:large subunit ribosomal protein L9|nr:50S ribosomal protein L9 [Myxococcales bacterium]
MAAHVQVVLLQDYEQLGYTGEVVRVRPGFARNFLVPRGIAKVATRANIKQIEHEKELARRKAEKLRAESEKLAAELAKLVVMVPKQAGEDGKLFGSVTAADIAEGLAHKGVEIDRKALQMPDQPIKVVGSYEIPVKLAHGVTATLKVEVKTAA